MSHSFLPPSSAARRVACPGSRSLEAKYPAEPTPHSIEGEAAHWVASQTIINYNTGHYQFPAIAPNGHEITKDMLEGAELYADAVFSVANKFPGVNLHIEERISIMRIHEECWGTPDLWFQAGNEIHIYDYKFGHVPIDVFENWQLIEYAAGILDVCGINGLNDISTNVVFYIVQPRSFHRDGQVRIWRTKASDLRGLFNVLEAAEEKAAHSFGVCIPNPECEFCSARHVCEALQIAALKSVEISKLNIPHDMPNAQKARELTYLRRARNFLEYRITGLEEHLLNQLRKGADQVPGFRIDQSQGREYWKVPVDEIITLGDLLGINLRKPIDVITPKQAKKLGINEKLVRTYSETTKGALKLIEDDGIQARKVFGVGN